MGFFGAVNLYYKKLLNEEERVPMYFYVLISLGLSSLPDYLYTLQFLVSKIVD